MKKLIKIIVIVFSSVVILALIAALYISSAMPSIELKKNIKAELTLEKIKRGEYLANSVTACFHCHSKVDFSKFSGKILDNSKGMGGRKYTEDDGFPGKFYSSNITPEALSDWSDAEIYRAITSGVSKDGRALFPLMPYPHYKYLSIEDAEAIISYLRTLQPQKTIYPKSEFNFPFSLIINLIPNEPEPSRNVDKSNSVEYGKYLVDIAGCESCHTPSDGGKPVEGMKFAGGFEIPMETGGTCRAANITADKETGIGSWSKDMFIKRFKYYLNNDNINVKHGEFNSEMPWRIYSGMSEEDLGSIYDYLRTVKPVKNKIVPFTP